MVDEIINIIDLLTELLIDQSIDWWNNLHNFQDNHIFCFIFHKV